MRRVAKRLVKRTTETKITCPSGGEVGGGGGSKKKGKNQYFWSKLAKLQKTAIPRAMQLNGKRGDPVQPMKRHRRVTVMGVKSRGPPAEKAKNEGGTQGQKKHKKKSKRCLAKGTKKTPFKTTTQKKRPGENLLG